MKIIWGEASSKKKKMCEALSPFFRQPPPLILISTCLNINLIFHYLNWFHLNEILLLTLPLERLLCVRTFFRLKKWKKKILAELCRKYLFEVYVSYLAIFSFNTAFTNFFLWCIKAKKNEEDFLMFKKSRHFMEI